MSRLIIDSFKGYIMTIQDDSARGHMGKVRITGKRGKGFIGHGSKRAQGYSMTHESFVCAEYIPGHFDQGNHRVANLHFWGYVNA